MLKSMRFAVLLGVLILLTPLLVACGGDDADDEPTAVPASPTAAAGDATATSGDGASTAEEAEESEAAGDETATGGGDEATATQAAPSTGEPTATEEQGATDPTSPPSDPVDGPVDFAYGWNVAMRGDEGGRRHNLETSLLVQKSGFEWVRLQLEWSQFQAHGPESWDPLPMDRVVQDLYSGGIKILVVVAKAPEWALDPSGQQLLKDYGDFERFMAFVADRYKGRVQAWEIWNEQNLAHEVNGTVRSADYVDLLRAGYNGVRASDPNALVVFGGLTPNGVNDPSIAIDDVQYLEEVYAVNDGEVRQYYDIMGAHVSATHTTPDNSFPDNPGPEGWSDHPSFYFRRAEELREVMVANGDADKTMWITEFGWTTENQAPGYEYGANNSEEEVAEYLTRSFEIMLDEWGWVSGAFVWNLNWSTLSPPEDEKHPWSAVNADWSLRPAFEAMRDMPKR